MLRLANVMQLALPSADAAPPQHGAPPAKTELARNPVARRANVILTMAITQHESANYSNPELGAIDEGGSSKHLGEDLSDTGFKLALRQFTRRLSNQFRSRSIVGRPYSPPICFGRRRRSPSYNPKATTDVTDSQRFSPLRSIRLEAAHFAENSSRPFFSWTLTV
jgi:hypothetical protein